MLSVERGEYMPLKDNHVWQIIGTKGSLKLRMTDTSSKEVIWDDTTTEDGVVTKKLWEGEEQISNIHAGPTTDFAAAIRENRPPKTTLEQALVVQQITDAIYASAETGTAIVIE